MKDFILSFIVPKKMINHRDMNIFIVILIFFGVFFLSISSSNFTARSFVLKHQDEISLYSFLENLTSEEEIMLPTIVVETINDVTEVAYDVVIDQRRIEKTIINDDSTIINLIIYYDLAFDHYDENSKTLGFDLDSYYRIVPEENEKGMLFIITKKYLFYIHNYGVLTNGQILFDRTSDGSSLYQLGEDEKPLYFLPSSIEEATNLNEFGEIDKSNWTKIADSSNLFENEVPYIVFDDISYYGIKKLKDDGSKTLFNSFYMDYYNAELLEFDLNGYEGTIKDLGFAWWDFMIFIYAKSIKSSNIIPAALYIFLLPLIFTLITWLLSKRHGELVLFREYFTLSAITSIIPAIISFIIGLFITYYMFAQYIMFFHAGYFLVSVYIINLKNIKKDSDNEQYNEIFKVKHKVSQKEVDWKNIHGDNEQNKPSKID